MLIGLRILEGVGWIWSERSELKIRSARHECDSHRG